MTNWLVDGGHLRVVDWEYSGAGDPCSDLAEFCTHPANLDIDPSLAASLIERHAQSLGSPELAERTRAFVVAHLCWWCSVTGTEQHVSRSRLAGAAPKFDANDRTGVFRDRLALALSMERSDVDWFLEI